MKKLALAPKSIRKSKILAGFAEVRSRCLAQKSTEDFFLIEIGSKNRIPPHEFIEVLREKYKLEELN